MSTFIKYMSNAHLCNKNIALYGNNEGATLVAEHIINDASIGYLNFSSIVDAEE